MGRRPLRRAHRAHLLVAAPVVDPGRHAPPARGERADRRAGHRAPLPRDLRDARPAHRALRPGRGAHRPARDRRGAGAWPRARRSGRATPTAAARSARWSRWSARWSAWTHGSPASAARRAPRAPAPGCSRWTRAASSRCSRWPGWSDEDVKGYLFAHDVPVQPAARSGLPLDRLHPLHPGDPSGRGLARRTLGGRREDRVRAPHPRPGRGHPPALTTSGAPPRRRTEPE